MLNQSGVGAEIKGFKYAGILASMLMLTASAAQAAPQGCVDWEKPWRTSQGCISWSSAKDFTPTQKISHVSAKVVGAKAASGQATIHGVALAESKTPIGLSAPSQTLDEKGTARFKVAYGSEIKASEKIQLQKLELEVNGQRLSASQYRVIERENGERELQAIFRTQDVTQSDEKEKKLSNPDAPVLSPTVPKAGNAQRAG